MRTLVGILFLSVLFALPGRCAEDPAPQQEKTEPRQPTPPEAPAVDQSADDDAEGQTNKETESKPTTENKRPPSSREMAAWFRALDAESIDERNQALEHLMQDKTETVRYLRRKFTGMGEDNRLKAVDLLRKARTDRARLLLAGRVYGDKYPSVRAASAEALNAIGSSRAARQYIADKAVSNHTKTWKKAARAICAIGDPQYVDELIAAAAESSGGGMVTGMNITRNSGMSTRSMRRVAPVGGGVNDTLDLPIQAPSSSTVETDDSIPALVAVTGKDFGRDLDRYARWWEKNRDSHAFPDLGSDDDDE